MLGLPTTDVRYIWHEIGLRDDHKHCNDDQIAIQQEYPWNPLLQPLLQLFMVMYISQMFLFNMDSRQSLYIKKYHLAYPSQLEE